MTVRAATHAPPTAERAGTRQASPALSRGGLDGERAALDAADAMVGGGVATSFRFAHVPTTVRDEGPAVPPEVDEALARPGAALEPRTRRSMERRFERDFSQVRVHTGPTATSSARSIGAAAYTAGADVVLGVGDGSAADPAGRWLLGHELAHVVQQADPGRRIVQRVGVGEFLSRLFSEGTFSDDELLAYLRFLDRMSQIEDDYDSDNKARAIVRRWLGGDQRFRPNVRIKALLVDEMLTGAAFDADERAILDLLAASSNTEVSVIVNTVSESRLRSAFNGSESDELEALLERWHASRESGRPATGAGRATIRTIIVDQRTPQTVTIVWSDGRRDTDLCSTGKGWCCVEEGGAGPSEAATTVGESAWTPVGTRKVFLKDPDHHGVKLWTEFHHGRQIALHEYSPVDGTPLSHGCVRLHTAMAQKIFDGAREHQTDVVVNGVPRPRCDHPPLLREWARDLAEAGTQPPDGDAKDDVAIRRHIAKTRSDLSRAMRVGSAGLDARVAEAGRLTGGLPTDSSEGTLEAMPPLAALIPKCGGPSPRRDRP